VVEREEKGGNDWRMERKEIRAAERTVGRSGLDISGRWSLGTIGRERVMERDGRSELERMEER
jgi:hypothetical protein